MPYSVVLWAIIFVQNFSPLMGLEPRNPGVRRWLKVCYLKWAYDIIPTHDKTPCDKTTATTRRVLSWGLSVPHLRWRNCEIWPARWPFVPWPFVWDWFVGFVDYRKLQALPLVLWSWTIYCKYFECVSNDFDLVFYLWCWVELEFRFLVDYE